MPQNRPSAYQLLEHDFLQCRSRLLDVAAFLDRLDRYPAADSVKEDFRYQALLQILETIRAGGGNRALKILLGLSDPTLQPVEDRVPPGKALGAWEGS